MVDLALRFWKSSPLAVLPASSSKKGAVFHYLLSVPINLGIVIHLNS
jgi:hypothetical protein